MKRFIEVIQMVKSINFRKVFSDLFDRREYKGTRVIKIVTSVNFWKSFSYPLNGKEYEIIYWLRQNDENYKFL